MNYTGWELQYFDSSSNFRKYQYFLIKEFIGNNVLEVGPGSGNFAENYLLRKAQNLQLTEINNELYKKLSIKFKDNNKVEIYSKKKGYKYKI